jgi:hypothetical protein
MKKISELKSGFKPKVTALMQEQVKSSKVLGTKKEQLTKLLANLKELKGRAPLANQVSASTKNKIDGLKTENEKLAR